MKFVVRCSVRLCVSNGHSLAAFRAENTSFSYFNTLLKSDEIGVAVIYNAQFSEFFLGPTNFKGFHLCFSPGLHILHFLDFCRIIYAQCLCTVVILDW